MSYQPLGHAMGDLGEVGVDVSIYGMKLADDMVSGGMNACR